ncbi:hypothetical protein RDJLphi1_gp66 [Roseobacter phage RDJL Phi 1]|uniref:Uncharacterized protein n=1 Tax=Roseobacter phage RDJL Phi 1 TaxID=562742 RepID=F4YXS7_9CAUD|nr:hypothetical protein RDJLphi1_gp66 [Roseobacter phage RDJL Phi 1]ADK73467.1 hypothetical protein RDJLphi1_gp66 [Roseobacter phage RDJL Phi 1]
MSTRIWTANDLDNRMTDEATRNIDVDCPEDFYKGAFLMGVYTDGRFEILPADSDDILTLNIADCKVFPAT